MPTYQNTPLKTFNLEELPQEPITTTQLREFLTLTFGIKFSSGGQNRTNSTQLSKIIKTTSIKTVPRKKTVIKRDQLIELVTQDSFQNFILDKALAENQVAPANSLQELTNLFKMREKVDELRNNIFEKFTELMIKKNHEDYLNTKEVLDNLINQTEHLTKKKGQITKDKIKAIRQDAQTEFKIIDPEQRDRLILNKLPKQKSIALFGDKLTGFILDYVKSILKNATYTQLLEMNRIRLNNRNEILSPILDLVGIQNNG